MLVVLKSIVWGLLGDTAILEAMKCANATGAAPKRLRSGSGRQK